MLRKGSWTVLVAAITTSAITPYLSTAQAAPIAPAAIAKQITTPVELASFWGWSFPVGYRYYPEQCYARVAVETPKGVVWKRVWICTEPGGRGLAPGGQF